MTNLTRIVAAVVDTKKLLMYREDGTTIEILQGDPRLRPIVEQITPLLASQGWADVDLQEENSWKEFEEKTNGAVRLFRIAKSKLASIFGTKKKEEPHHVGPTVEIGKVPCKQTESVAVQSLPTVTKQQAAVEEILKHATPVQSRDFDETKVAAQRPTSDGNGRTPNDQLVDGRDAHFESHEDTIVAVTPKGNIVSGVERIKSQFVGVTKSGNAKGLTLFLERLAAVAKERQHTSDDLLRFMERGDLPIADDGTIIIYKKLYRTTDGYMDPHSKRVKQKVGSYVHMDAKLVDPNRRNECSNGLHVARRGYIHSFNGDVIVLAKVKPEDVIAVPEYDANKMRVCGYHIIAELSAEQYLAINRNRPISDAVGGEELLANAVAGEHIGVIQRVKITGAVGTGLEITDLVDKETKADPAQEQPATEVTQESVMAAPADPTTKVKKAVTKRVKKAQRKVAVKKAKVVAAQKKVKPLEAASPARTGAAPVDVKAVQKLKEGDSTALKPETKPQLTQTDVVKAMWDAALSGVPGKAKELLDFKKKAKKGWTVWGLPETAGETLKALLED